MSSDASGVTGAWAGLASAVGLPTAIRLRACRGARDLGGRLAWLLDSVTGRFLVLLALGVLVGFSYKLMTWEARPDGAQVLVPQVPVPPVLWFTVAWLLILGLVWMLLSRRGPARPPTADVNLRRIALLVVVAVYATDLLTRVLGARGFGLESRLGLPGALALVVAVVAGTALLARRPPPLLVIMAGLLALGLAMRALYLATYPIDAQRADNMEMVRRGLERLVAGQTPYAFQDFGTHITALTYLPWTVLSYLPPFLLGVDIRWSSVALSLALTLGLWTIIRALPLPRHSATALTLVVGLYYVLPYNVSNDGLTEIEVFVIALALTFGLLGLGRLRLAAVSFGVALGAFMLSVYFLPTLAVYTLRQRPARRAATLVSIVVAVGLMPTLVFVAWDPQGFSSALSDAPLDAWRRLDEGRWADWAFTPSAWHALVGGRLRLVQAALGLLFVGLAVTRLRTLHGVIGLSIATYLGMVLTGAYVGGHFFAPVLYLMVVAEAIRELGPVSTVATRSAGTDAGLAGPAAVRQVQPEPASQPPAGPPARGTYT